MKDPARLEPGERLDQFEVLRLLGEGGESRVYLARDTNIGRLVALKLPRGEGDLLREIEREARLLAQLDHPALVRVWQVGAAHGTPYLALEHVDAPSLRRRLDHGTLERDVALEVARSLAGALAAAHANGIAHGDVKPENVLLAGGNGAKLIDFGLARAADAAHSNGLSGTLAYLAPEAFATFAATPARDVFALGILLFECLTGKRPFDGTAQTLNDRELAGQLRERRFGPPLEPLLLRMLAREPTARPSAAFVAEELERAEQPRFRSAELARPFRGLEPYLPEHAALFFGREAETAALAERVLEQPLVGVVGPSGVGKSSLVLAGLLPSLEARGWRRRIALRPGADPFRALAHRLIETSSVSLVPGAKPPEMGDEARLAAELAARPSLAASMLSEAAAQHGTPVLVVVDQAEELFAVASTETRAAFAMALVAMMRGKGLHVVLTLRDDFLGRVAELPELASMLERQLFLLRPPLPSSLRDLLTRAVLAFGFAFEEPALLEDMLASLRGQPGALALLQFAADRMWRARDTARGLLTRSAFDAMGGVEGALAEHAEAVLLTMSPEVVHAARRVLLRLLTAEGTRKSLPIDDLDRELGHDASEAMWRLVDARLLLTQRDTEGRASVELSHESLLVTWSSLRRWREESQVDVELERFLRSAAARWKSSKNAAVDRLRGASLAEALAWRTRAADVSPEIDALLRASEEGEARRRRFRRRLRTATVMTLAFVVVLSLGATALVLSQARRAREGEAQAMRALAASLVEGAEAAMAREEPIEARAKMRASLELVDSPRARAAWANVLESPLAMHVHGEEMFYAATFTHDGRLAVAGSTDTVRFFDRATAEETRFAAPGTGSIFDLLSTDDDHLVLAGSNGRVLSVDVRTGAVETAIEGPRTLVRHVALSPNGRYLAAAFATGPIFVRDRDTHSVRELGRHASGAVGVAFTSDGELVSGGADGVRRWRLGAAPDERVPELGFPVSALATSPERHMVAIADPNGAVVLWDASTGARRTLYGHAREVKALAFDGARGLLASGGWDGVRLWSLDGEGSVEVPGHTDGVYGLSFDPKSGLLASAATDRTVRVTDPAKVFRAHSSHHGDRVHGVAFSRDGQLVASASADRTVRIWHAATGVSRRLAGTSASIATLEFDPVEPAVYVLGRDGSLKRVDVVTAEETRLDRRSDARAFATSDDGKTFAAVLDDVVQLTEKPSQQPIWSGVTLHAPLHRVAFSHDGRSLLSVDAAGNVDAWSTHGEPRRSLFSFPLVPFTLSVRPGDAWLAGGSSDHKVRMFRVGSPHESYTLDADAESVWVVRFSRDGRLLGAIGDDAAVTLWNVEHLEKTPERVGRIGAGTSANEFDFGPDGSIAASCDDDTVRTWNADGTLAWHAPAVLPFERACIRWPTLSPAARRAAEIAGLAAHIARRESPCADGVLTRELDACAESARGPAVVSPDERRIALACHGEIEVFDRGTQAKVATFPSADGFALNGAGLVRLDGGMARYVPLESGLPEHDLGGPFDLVSGGDTTVALAREGSFVEVDVATGRHVATTSLDAHVTAMAFHDGVWGVGTADGGTYLGWPGTTLKRAFLPRVLSPVTALAIERDLFAVGHRDGTAHLVSLADGQLLRAETMHGAVSSLVFDRHALVIASALGDAWHVDLAPFRASWCELLRNAVTVAPAVWQNGRPVRRNPPSGTACGR